MPSQHRMKMSVDTDIGTKLPGSRRYKQVRRVENEGRHVNWVAEIESKSVKKKRKLH